MADRGSLDVRSARPPAPRVGKRIRSLTALVAALLCLADGAEARIAIRRHSPYDNFFFHGNYSAEPFDPSSGFGLEVWNCQNGAVPIFVADREPLIVCTSAGETGFTLADLVYSVVVPAGSCVDHGRSCYYRNGAVPARTAGVRYFRVQYARPGHGNRVWLDSYGDLSSADRANMLMLITLDGHPRATRADTFTPTYNGGWVSR